MGASRIVVAVAMAACIAGCGQSDPPQPAQSDPGPPGARGRRRAPRPPGASGVRLVRATCDATNCTVQCDQDEVLITAWCGVARNPALFATEKSASCRIRGPANNPLSAACAKATSP